MIETDPRLFLIDSDGSTEKTVVVFARDIHFPLPCSVQVIKVKVIDGCVNRTALPWCDFKLLPLMYSYVRKIVVISS